MPRSPLERRHWFGMLTLENLDDVAERIRQMLTGQRYTFVSIHEMYRWRPEVRTDQELKPEETRSGNAVSVWVHESGDFGGFHVGDTYGVWGCHTNLKTNTYDPQFKNPYLKFTSDQIQITHRAGANNLLYWVIALQHGDKEEIDSVLPDAARVQAVFERFGLPDIPTHQLETGTYDNMELTRRAGGIVPVSAMLLQLPGTDPASKRSMLSFMVDMNNMSLTWAQ